MRARALTLYIILAAGLALAAAVLAAPVRVDLGYDGQRLTMICRLGPVSLRLLPRPKRRGTGEQGPKRRLARLMWANGGEAVYKLIGSMHIELLRIHFTAGGPDVFDAAMAYAHMGAAMEALDHFAAGRIERTDLRAGVDFSGGETVLDGRMRLRARLFHVLRAGFRFGTGCLRAYSRQGVPHKTKG